MSHRNEPIILVVDPCKLSITATSAILYYKNYDVHAVANHGAAIKAARELNIDLILCDEIVGDTSGPELVSEILQIPGRSQVPAMFSSSRQMAGVIRRTHEFGSTFHLRKPFDANVLLELVGKELWMPHLVHSHINQPHFKLAPGAKLMPTATFPNTMTSQPAF